MYCNKNEAIMKPSTVTTDPFKFPTKAYDFYVTTNCKISNYCCGSTLRTLAVLSRVLKSKIARPEPFGAHGRNVSQTYTTWLSITVARFDIYVRLKIGKIRRNRKNNWWPSIFLRPRDEFNPRRPLFTTPDLPSRFTSWRLFFFFFAVCVPSETTRARTHADNEK